MGIFDLSDPQDLKKHSQWNGNLPPRGNGTYAYSEGFEDGSASAAGYRYERKGVTYSGGVSGGMGEWLDRNTGLVNKGWNVEGGVLKAAGSDDDLGIGTFQAGAYHNKNTTGIGAQANLLEGSKTTLYDGENNGSVRVGLSEGWGAGARIHHGDSNNNGKKEWGFGFDVGPLSMDVKTEDAWDLLSPGGAMAGRWLKDFNKRPLFGSDPGYDSGPSDGGKSGPNPGVMTGPVNPKTPDHSPIDGHSGGEPLAPSNSLLDMLPSMPDGGVISNGFKSPLDLLPSLPKISLPEGPMLDGGLTSPFADLF